MSSEWPAFPAAVTPALSHTLYYNHCCSLIRLVNRVGAMAHTPLLPGMRYHNDSYASTQRPARDSAVIEPLCTFLSLTDCRRGKERHIRATKMLNIVESASRRGAGRVLHIGEVPPWPPMFNARVTQVAARDLARRADVLCQPFDFVVVAGDDVGPRDQDVRLVVDVVNAIGAPVLWYGRHSNVDAVTVVK
jgi:hypothetical protein